MQTRPNVREAWTETQNANLVRGGRVRILQDQEARAHRSRSSDSGTSGGTGGIPGQTSQGTGPDQVLAESLWGRNLARVINKGIAVEKGQGKGGKREQEPPQSALPAMSLQDQPVKHKG